MEKWIVGQKGVHQQDPILYGGLKDQSGEEKII